MRRQLQIDNPEAVGPHDHVLWCGDGVDDLYSMAATALAAGARRREKLLFVGEDPEPGRLAVDGLDRLLGSGQLEVLPIEEVYGTWSDFDAAAQLETFEGVLADALSSGYRGIRVVADNTPLVRGDEDGFRRWLAWEQLTDHFQATSEVTGICYFDTAALSPERRADLASVHPVRAAGAGEPRFTLTADQDVVSLAGTVDLWSAEQFGRILDTTPPEGMLVVDVSQVDFADHRAVLALNAVATAERPILIRGARPPMSELAQLLGVETPHLHFA